MSFYNILFKIKSIILFKIKSCPVEREQKKETGKKRRER